MSADRWRICPACLMRQTEEWTTLVQWCADNYGQVSADEYTKAASRARDMFNAFPDADETDNSNCTYRENYETYVRDGVLYFDYSGWCTTKGCDYKFNHRHSVEVPQP